jgi:dUTP pyrophosphatase
MMPPDGYYFRISPRSGNTRLLALYTLDGTVDAGYTGEIEVPLENKKLGTTIIVKQGDRIAQAIFAPILHPQFEQVTNFTVTSKDHRGPQGFGSSGK